MEKIDTSRIMDARRLLAHLGWTYDLPLVPNRDGVVAWRGEVPIISTVTKRELATDRKLRDAGLWGDDMDALDHGTLRITQPTATEWGKSQHPLEWAMHALEALDTRYRVADVDVLPDMPEAETLGEIRSIADERNSAWVRKAERARLVLQARREGHTVAAIAEILGISPVTVYGVQRDHRMLEPAEVDDVLGALAAVAQREQDVRMLEARRDDLIRQARTLGVSAATIVRWAGLERARVNQIIAEGAPS